MPVQPIRSTDGQVVGYQARFGNASKYFATAKHGGPELAHALASRVERSLRRAAGPRAQRALQANNTSGLNGLRLVWRPSEGDNPPTLQVQASWHRRGVAHSTSFSVERNGKVGATQLAITAIERGTGKAYPLTARAAWAVMARRVEG